MHSHCFFKTQFTFEKSILLELFFVLLDLQMNEQLTYIWSFALVALRGLSLLRSCASSTAGHFRHLLTCFDAVVTPENVPMLSNNRSKLGVHLLLILFSTLYGVLFLELEATGTIHWRRLWTSPYTYSYQMVPRVTHLQINTVATITAVAEALIYASFTALRPIAKGALLIKVNDDELEQGGTPLSAQESVAILAVRRRLRKLLTFSVSVCYFASLSFFYLNVYHNAKYVVSVHCLAFYWGALFPLRNFYAIFSELKSVFYLFIN